MSIANYFGYKQYKFVFVLKIFKKYIHKLTFILYLYCVNEILTVKDKICLNICVYIFFDVLVKHIHRVS